MLSERKGNTGFSCVLGSVCVSEGEAEGILPATLEPFCKLSVLGGAQENKVEESLLIATVLKIVCKKKF